MLRIVVAARKDAKAVRHAVDADVQTLENFEVGGFMVFLAAKRDARVREAYEDVASKHPLCVLQEIRKEKVRNARLEEIRGAIEIAKARLRIGMSFDGCYFFDVRNGLRLEIHPDYDVYFVIGRAFVERLRSIGVNAGEGSVVLRKLYGVEEYYSPQLIARLKKPIGGSIEVESFGEGIEVSIGELVKRNEEWLKAIESVSIEFLQENASNAIVPVSGGKDSTAALILAKKALGDVKALFVKTNYDMPYTEEYVDYIAGKLGVEVIEERIEFDISKGLPSFDDRWCTAKKLEVFRRFSSCTLIAGDRDAESRVRRMRGDRHGNELFPIKYWSGGMVQLYVLWNGLKLHPLYYEGFYRLGCTICPSLGPWERILLSEVQTEDSAR